MLKNKPQIKREKLFSNRGFTMMEVLTGILIISLFVIVSMQAVALNAFFKVQAEREALANFWIQQDLEKVRAEAANLDKDSPIDTVCQATTYSNGYAQKLQDELLKQSGTIKLSSEKVEVGTKSFVNKLTATTNNEDKFYKLVRIYIADNNFPSVLKINYQVGTLKDWDSSQKGFKAGSNSPVAHLYAEVIPNVAFDCEKK